MEAIRCLYEQSLSFDELHKLKNLRDKWDRGKTGAFTKVVLQTATSIGFEENRTQSVQQAFEELIQTIDWDEKLLPIAAELLAKLDRFSKSLFGTEFIFVLVRTSEHFRCVKWLIENQLISVNQQNSQLYSPLHVCCSTGNLALVRLFVENNANISLCTSTGKTPLQMAQNRNYPAIVEYLQTCASAL